MAELDRQSGNLELTNPIVTATGELSEPLYSLLSQAVEERATDIHLDPVDEGKLVRFRVDGMIYPRETLHADDHRRVLTQVKVAAGFSIARSFVPEEGMIVFEHEGHPGQHHIRVSTVPAGLDRVALHFRFLTTQAAPMNFLDLGMSEAHRERIEAVLKSPMGLILIAGVTGSGKSSTMYALADALDLESNVGASIEDPIEMSVRGLRQIEVDAEHDFQMQDGLRSILRMDPDVVFVGEIRDRSSAVTAARAAIAGRLVVSTVHAPDPALAVEALHHYNVPRYIIASALRLVITQYLLRRLCPKCLRSRAPEQRETELFSSYGVTVPEELFEPGACDACRRYGYSGRTGVFELTVVNDETASDIASGTDKISLLRRFREQAGPSFMVDALDKARRGVVSIADVWQLYLNTENR